MGSFIYKHIQVGDNITKVTKSYKGVILLKQWEDVLKDVDSFEKNKVDMVLNTGSLVMSSGVLASNGDAVGTFGDWSFTQLCGLLGMPGRYFKGLYFKDKAYNLVADHVNYNIRRLDDKDLFIRTRDLGDNGCYIRGILSDRYTVFDNKDLMVILDKIFGEAKYTNTYKINHFHLDESVFHLRLTFPDLTANVGTSIDGQEDMVTGGVHISNSEVGKRSVIVEPLVFRLICSNGLMGWTTDSARGFKQRHLWLRPDEMYNRVADGIGRALRANTEVIELIKKARSQPVDNPLEMIEELMKDSVFTKKDTEAVKLAYSVEPEPTLFGVTNAFTRAAKDMVSDKMVEMEAMGGKVLVKQLAA